MNNTLYNKHNIPDLRTKKLHELKLENRVITGTRLQLTELAHDILRVILENDYLSTVNRYILFNADFIYAIGLEWTNGKGKWVKRLAKYVKDQSNEKLPNAVLGKIGDMTYRYTIDTSYYDFTQKFNWIDGDFGDDGSCFFGGEKEGALDAMEIDGNVYAMRFFIEDNNGKFYGKKYRGISRCWVYASKKYNLFVLFNAYGFHRLEQMGKILQKYLSRQKMVNLSQKHTRLNNDGRTVGLIYINNGEGLLVGDRLALDSYTDRSYDLRIDTYYETCELCGCNLHDSDWQEDVHPYGLICEECFTNRCFTCRGCGEYYALNHEDYYDAEDGLYCYECYRYNFFECKDCRETFHLDDRSEVDFVCEDCYSCRIELLEERKEKKNNGSDNQ